MSKTDPKAAAPEGVSTAWSQYKTSNEVAYLLLLTCLISPLTFHCEDNFL